jgi:hypothetical protein
MFPEFRRQTLVKLAKLVTPGPLSTGIAQQFNITDISPPVTAKEFKPVPLHVPNPGKIGSVRVMAPPNYGVQGNQVNIVFHFRGAGSGSIYSKAGTNAIVVAVDAPGVGGGAMASYGNAQFINTAQNSLLNQVRKITGNPNLQLGNISFVGWSGGYDPMGRLFDQKQWERLEKKPVHIAMLDGGHYGQAGKPNAERLQPWLQVAQRAQQGELDFYFTHTAVTPGRSERFPNGYASTTDTANWLLGQMNMQRQQAAGVASRADAGGFHVIQLYDQESPYKIRDPRTGQWKANIPGTSGYQHIDALRRAPEVLPTWD